MRRIELIVQLAKGQSIVWLGGQQLCCALIDLWSCTRANMTHVKLERIVFSVL